MAELADNEAVIMLPEHVTISLSAAREGLSTTLSMRSVEAAQVCASLYTQMQGQTGQHNSSSLALEMQANPLMLLALHLAAEKRRGKASVWATYIKSLPKQAPSGWAMRKDMQTSRAKGELPLQLTGSSVSWLGVESASLPSARRTGPQRLQGRPAACQQAQARRHLEGQSSLRHRSQSERSRAAVGLQHGEPC